MLNERAGLSHEIPVKVEARLCVPRSLLLSVTSLTGILPMGSAVPVRPIVTEFYQRRSAPR
jgi:hypothetical protein